ncbi:hypothetical protein PHYSODRAFT_421713, partial [Phytophthora sojae]
RGNSTSTVLSKLCHISWYHNRFVGYKVGLSPGHQLAVVGMRREDPPTNPKAPVTMHLLGKLHSSLDFSWAQHRVIWGASVLGFFFLLRRSEYLADGTRVKEYAIQRSDVRFLDDQGRDQKLIDRVKKVQIRFRGSKTDQFGDGCTRVLGRSGRAQCCPVMA